MNKAIWSVLFIAMLAMTAYAAIAEEEVEEVAAEPSWCSMHDCYSFNADSSNTGGYSGSSTGAWHAFWGSLDPKDAYKLERRNVVIMNDDYIDFKATTPKKYAACTTTEEGQNFCM